MKKLSFKLFGVFALLLIFLSGCSNQITVLNPQGPVARQEYFLIIWTFAIMALVVLVVFVIFAYVLIRYGRKNSTGYDPNNEGNVKLEIIWTVIPVILIVLMIVPTVTTLFNLDKPPVAVGKTSNKKPITIVATSVDWKWLFTYPDQKIETVNYAVIPANRPVKIELRAIGAMNSFWVPALAGQQYTMPNMPMSMWLAADHPGDFLGRSANFSGRGFTDMTFHILAKKQSGFDQWVSSVKKSKPALTTAQYNDLLKPSNVGKMTFSNYPKQIVRDSKMQMHMNMSKDGSTQKSMKSSSMKMKGGKSK